MSLSEWDRRYRQQARDSQGAPSELLTQFAGRPASGARALDLACGSGTNAVWLAQQGWHVTAVDGSSAAMELTIANAKRARVSIHTVVADIERHEFQIAPSTWDLISVILYLQRDLFESVKEGVVPGGLAMVSVLLHETDRAGNFRVVPGELRAYFASWEIVHYYEGRRRDSHAVAEIVARKVS